MRSFEFVQENRLDFGRIGAWSWMTTPLLFMLAVELIRHASPAASGSGIPQAIFAAKHLNSNSEKNLWPLLSSKTMVVKIVAILIGILAGASAGREGPTVHIATCVFIGTLFLFRRFIGFEFDLRSAVVAGGAAGLASAFNTPLAGIS
jgi:H+/Cl- antiporter ClcA